MKTIEKILFNEASHKHRVFSVIMVCILLIFSAWQTDDAYHAYTMARNLVEGNGFVYIVGERVNASTCPLWTLLCALMYAICNNMYIGSLVLCILCSTAAMAILAHYCKTIAALIFCTALFIFSPCLVFGTSGLENPLLFLLTALQFVLLQKDGKEKSKSDLLAVALVMSMTAITRMDVALIFAPACIVIYLFHRHKRVSFLSSLFIGFAGLIPFIGWCVFSTWYYGFPFPNTAYSKLYTALPMSFYLTSGTQYLFWSFFCYIALPVALFFLIYLLHKTKDICISHYLLMGIIIYYVYILSVGGDFMLGRHYSVVHFLGLLIIAHSLHKIYIPEKTLFSMAFATSLCTCISLLVSILFFLQESTSASSCSLKRLCNIEQDTKFNILNSRNFSIEMTSWGGGFTALFRPDRIKNGMFTDIFSFRKIDPHEGILSHIRLGHRAARIWSAEGNLVYAYSSRIHLIDHYGLGDALIARLPTNRKAPRIGHIIRAVPNGYVATLESGTNVITDPKLHEYYEHLKVVISGDLFSLKRLQEIYYFNSGRYEHLVR